MKRPLPHDKRMFDRRLRDNVLPILKNAMSKEDFDLPSISVDFSESMLPEAIWDEGIDKIRALKDGQEIQVIAYCGTNVLSTIFILVAEIRGTENPDIRATSRTEDCNEIAIRILRERLPKEFFSRDAVFGVPRMDIPEKLTRQGIVRIIVEKIGEEITAYFKNNDDIALEVVHYITDDFLEKFAPVK